MRPHAGRVGRMPDQDLHTRAADSLTNASKHWHDLFQADGLGHDGAYEECTQASCATDRHLVRELLGVAAVHDYLSTACLHGRHDYCSARSGQVGPKTPATCKFCPAKCRCTCHAERGDDA